MSPRYQRIVDLAQLIGLLQSTRYGISLDQIAERYEVSRRTAERLLAAVRDCYPDLEAEQRDGRKFWRLPRPKERRSSIEPPAAMNSSLDDWVNKIVFRAINFVRPDGVSREHAAAERILKAVVEEIRDAARGHNVKLNVEVDERLQPFQADVALIVSALIEMGRNAIEAMPDGGTLRLRAELLDGGQKMRFGVSDTGPGIPVDIRQQIFEPFFSTKANHPGLGLGMVQTIVSGHRGRVVVGDNGKGGATLWIEIPTHAPSQTKKS